MKKILIISVLNLFAGQAFAIDLIGVYQQALQNDPTFKIARAQWLSDRQNVPISRSQLLPQFDIQASYDREYQRTTFPDTDTLSFSSPVSTYNLTLSQTLFDFALWSQLQSAKSSVKASTATYAAAAQDLIFRTTSAYLAVLQATDILNFSRADRASYASQLEQTTQRFKVGLATITDLEQARAAYDSSLASEIKASNDLTVNKAKLAEITGRLYDSYAQLSSTMPLIYPNPANIDRWVYVGLNQNYYVKADQYLLEASREDIKAARAGNFPTIQAQGNYNYSKNGTANVNSGFLFDRQQTNTVATAGINLDFPVVQGGGVIAKTIQAEHNYEKAESTLDQTRKSTISNIRQAYAGVVDGINQVKANKQSVISHTSSYKSTIAAYHVGTNTMVDILQQQSQLYQAQKDYAVPQYSYITQTLALKNASGILSADDVRNINNWLKKERIPLKNLEKAKPIAKSKPVIQSKPIPANKKSVTAAPNSINPSSLNNYTIQVMAAKNAETLQDTVKKYNLSNYYITQIKHADQKWKVLIIGNYKTKQDAVNALSCLPKNLTSALHPFVRKFSDLQKEM